MANEKIELLGDIYETAIRTTLSTAEKVPEDKRMSQIKEGRAHPLWLMGHLGFSLDMVTTGWILGGERVLSDENDSRFSPKEFGGAPITGDPNDYPSWDEVIENYKKAGARTVEVLRTLSDDQLPGDVLGGVPENAKDFFGPLGASLMSMAQHDANHRGQLNLLLGLW